MGQIESVLCGHNVFYGSNVTLRQIVLKNSFTSKPQRLGPPLPCISLDTAFSLRECITCKQLDFYHGFQLGTPSTFVVGKPVYLTVLVSSMPSSFQTSSIFRNWYPIISRDGKGESEECRSLVSAGKFPQMQRLL